MMHNWMATGHRLRQLLWWTIHVFNSNIMNYQPVINSDQ
jgi:hypothetical protein